MWNPITWLRLRFGYWSRFYNALMFLNHEATESDKQLILQSVGIKELQEALTSRQFLEWYESVVKEELDAET